MMEINNGTKIYTNGDHRVFALNNVNLRIEKGEMIAITGHSGSGKSTLLHILANYEKLTYGEYKFQCKSINRIEPNYLFRNHIGMIYQDYQLMDYLNGRDNILLARHYLNNQDDIDEFNFIVKQLKIDKLLDKKISHLSGGEKQRIAIARVLYGNKSIILADEPTGALDRKNSEQIMELLKQLNKQGKTIVIVTHDEYVASCCDRRIIMENGHVL